jgi:DNA-binding NarL/FixJ family response regulator
VPTRCLIVDDNPSFLRAASGLLEREGLGIAGLASTADEALRHARNLRPDVVLVDIALGSESGVELSRRLVHELCGEVPVILISTRAEEEVVELLETCPAVAFLAKSSLSATAIEEIVRAEADGGASQRRGT